MLCAMRLDKRIGSATEIIDHQKIPEPEMSVHNITDENSTEIGTSIGINCSVWPKEATEWQTRQRKNNWPTKQTIDDLVTLGCYLLPIPHHQSSDPGNEWQLSFAKVEMELFRQLGPHQKTCYLFMEILYQHYITDLGTLSLHHMKTCFLWMCEQVATDEWQEENTEDVLLRLLDDIILCMLKANIPDYFIPDNNTLDQFNPEHLRSTVETLQTIKDDIIQSRMPHLKLSNRYLIEDYDTIQAALDFNGVTKYTVQNYYSKPSGIFQQIMDIMPSDNTCDTSESEKYILASLGIGLTLVLTNQTTSAISAFSDGIDGMQMLGLLPKEWSTRLSSVLVSSLLIETALGVARCHITSVLEHIQELLSSHIKQTQGSEESLLAYTQSACLNVLYSRSYNDCDTVIDCLKALGSANHPLNCILRAAYSKVNKDEHGCKSWLQKFLKFESVILRTLVKIHSSKPTENAASRFEPGVQLIHVANMARQIAKEDKTKLNRLYVTAGMYTDILVYECEYAGGVLQVQAGLLASLMLVTSTQECDTLVVHALDNLTKPITYHQWFLVGFAWYTIKNFKKAKKAFKETLKHNPGHLGASIFGILCDERQFFLSNRKKNATFWVMKTLSFCSQFSKSKTWLMIETMF
ncbi:hypothetical protein CAPTEDRAFT_185615 [Capitella teleta]|uniref:Uncharacterized protein n=1 Tax=Capitella teleta TaxID=283909 RepID=R7VAM4_CAPTE|nr:hypothetical protein CAPTEDRAFT_185615 [Capitella teleta]|eukprot:ELU13391.1 hypothetical protein CAPTEDRAFT_185615 [Capitella teleta]